MLYAASRKSQEAGLAAELLHGGHDNIQRENVDGLDPKTIQRKLLVGGTYNRQQGVITRRSPAWLVAIAFVIVGVAYSIVNHTQAMRMFASKSEWDMKMSVWVAGAAMLAMTFFNLTMGVMGRALFPDQCVLPGANVDAIYPHLTNQFAGVGLKGIVIAGVLAASFSTYDSIGSTLSALLTRDVYARLIVTDKDDHHYMRVGQWLTPIIIGGSFIYIPFMKGGMLLFYIDLTSTFVIPLLTLFLMGVLTRVHRRAGLIGLLVGAGYGVMRLLAPLFAETYGIAILPSIMTNTFAAYVFSILITGGTMVLVSLLTGWEAHKELLHAERKGWLRSSQLAIQQLESASQTHTALASRLPAVLAVVAFAIGCTLSFLVFW